MNKSALSNHTIEEDNLVFLKEWSVKFKDETEDRDLREYFETLTFHDLLNESLATAKELRSKSLNRELVNRSKILLDECNKRLNGSSDEFSQSLLKIKEYLENWLSTPSN